MKKFTPFNRVVASFSLNGESSNAFCGRGPASHERHRMQCLGLTEPGCQAAGALSPALTNYGFSSFPSYSLSICFSKSYK